jgi:hypothetical protein
MQFVIPTLPSQNPTIDHKTIFYITGSLVESDMDGVNRIGFCSELVGIHSEGRIQESLLVGTYGGLLYKGTHRIFIMIISYHTHPPVVARTALLYSSINTKSL